MRQNLWVIYLLEYKQSENIEGLLDGIKNAVKFLTNSIGEIQVLFEHLRMLIGMFLFGNTSSSRECSLHFQSL